MDEQAGLDRLKQGVAAWNRWRAEHRDVTPRLPRMTVGLPKELAGVDFSGMDLFGMNLMRRDLSGANLEGSRLASVSLWGVNLRGASLRKADLQYAHLQDADLTGADLRDADLTSAFLQRVDLSNAVLSGARVYGVSVWDTKLDGAEQAALILSPKGQPVITVDDIEIAQFLYLLLNNAKIRRVIDTITSKVVLILGRFTAERKHVLDALREELRRRDCVPVLFDFEKPATRDLSETVSTLAHMARFVIADITDAKSIPQELQLIVADLPSVPVQPLVLESQREYAMFEHFRRYPWVLEPYIYADEVSLIASLQERVIAPAEAMAGRQTAGPAR